MLHIRHNFNNMNLSIGCNIHSLFGNKKTKAIFLSDYKRIVGYFNYGVNNWQYEVVYTHIDNSIKHYNFCRLDVGDFIIRIDDIPSGAIRRICVLLGKSNVMTILNLAYMAGSKTKFTDIINIINHVRD